jgi:hypothetical protein
MARFTSSSLVGLNQWAHTCARIQPSLVNGDPPVSPEGTWTWNNYPGKSTLNPAPAWNNFISNIEGIMFRVDVTAWGGSESFILDSICLSPCLTDTVTLTVNSVPCSGVSISATPLDIHGNGVGTSSFTMDYIDGAIVYLTAPPTVICDGEQYCFRNWIINGMNFLTDSNNPVKVKMNADKNYTAVYCKKNKTVDVKARLNNLNGMLLPGVLIGYSPSPYYANPNGLIPVPFSSGPTAPTPFFGTYYYPDCSSNVEYFQLTAPLFYNNHRFITWYVGFTDCYGYSYSLIPTGSNVISYPLDKDYICTAIYDDCCLATVTNAGASCCDGSIDFSFACGTAPYSYAWSNTEVTQDISGLCPGTYCVTVTDSNNNTYVCCWDVAQNKSACQSTFIQNQVIESGRDTCFGALQTIYVAGNGTTFDIQNGGRATMVAGQNIRFLPGTKVLSGGYLHGYIAPSGPFCNVTLPNNPSFNTFGDEVLQGNTLGFYHVYPNPTTGSFFLELNDLDEQAVLRTEIYGMHGEHLFSALLKDQGRYELSLAGKPSGVYFLRVITGKHAGISKIIKQ